MNINLKAHFLTLLATFLIGGSFIVSGKLSGVIDPISLTLYRFVLAAFCLAPLILLTKKYRIKIFSSFSRAMIISFFYSAYFIGLFKALEFTTPLHTGTLYTLVPLFTALGAVFVFHQKINVLQFIIYILGIIGTCIVIFDGHWDLLMNFSLNLGDSIFLLAVLSMVLYAISTKYFYRKNDEVLTLTFMTLVGGIIWMSLALTFFHIPLEWGKITGISWLYMFYLSIFATLITVYLYQKATIILGPKKMMAYVYVNPLSIALLGFVFEREMISFGSFLGICISTLATIVLLWKKA